MYFLDLKDSELHEFKKKIECWTDGLFSFSLGGFICVKTVYELQSFEKTCQFV